MTIPSSTTTWLRCFQLLHALPCKAPRFLLPTNANSAQRTKDSRGVAAVILCKRSLDQSVRTSNEGAMPALAFNYSLRSCVLDQRFDALAFFSGPSESESK